MCISGTEPSSVILSQTNIKKLKMMPQKCLNKLKPKGPGWCKKSMQLQFQSILNTDNFYALQTLRINRSRVMYCSLFCFPICMFIILVEKMYHFVLQLSFEVSLLPISILAVTLSPSDVLEKSVAKVKVIRSGDKGYDNLKYVFTFCVVYLI